MAAHQHTRLPQMGWIPGVERGAHTSKEPRFVATKSAEQFDLQALHRVRSRLVSQRTATVPGIGPIISSATVAAIGTGDVFSKGHDFGAWLGLVPKQISIGDRTILGRISKRGNRYLPRPANGEAHCPW